MNNVKHYSRAALAGRKIRRSSYVGIRDKNNTGTVVWNVIAGGVSGNKSTKVVKILITNTVRAAGAGNTENAKRQSEIRNLSNGVQYELLDHSVRARKRRRLHGNLQIFNSKKKKKTKENNNHFLPPNLTLRLCSVYKDYETFFLPVLLNNRPPTKMLIFGRNTNRFCILNRSKIKNTL